MKKIFRNFILCLFSLLIIGHGFSIVYAEDDRLVQFEKTLDSYEVEGISLGSKMSAIDKTLIGNGYKLKRKDQNKSAYIKREAKDRYKIVLRRLQDGDAIKSIKIQMPNNKGAKWLAEEKIRLLKAFKGSCTSESYYISCLEYTDTNALFIMMTFLKKRIEYSIENAPSGTAKSLAHARGHER